MKRFLLALALIAPLAACSTPDPGYLLATKTALTTYADVFQPAVLTYGRLPDCPGATICKDRVTLDKLKAADLAVASSVEAARPVLDGSKIDSATLTATLLAIQKAESTIANSGALKIK